MQQSRAIACRHMSEGGSLYAASEMFVLMDFLHVCAALNNIENTSSIELSMRSTKDAPVTPVSFC